MCSVSCRQFHQVRRRHVYAMAGIEQMEQELAAVEATLAEELKIYNQIKAVNSAEMEHSISMTNSCSTNTKGC